MMILEHDDTFGYRGYHGTPSRCRLRIWRGLASNSHLYLVMVSELRDNPGTSITNRAEQLIAEVCAEFSIDPHDLVWVEHYPGRPPRHLDRPGTPGVEHFSTVKIDQDTGKASWEHTERSTVERVVLCHFD